MNASLFTNFGAPEGEDPLAQLRRERESRKAFFFIQTVLKEGGIPGKQLADTLYFLLSKGAQEAAFPREWVVEASTTLKRLSMSAPTSLGRMMSDITGNWDEEMLELDSEDPFNLRRMLAWNPLPDQECADEVCDELRSLTQGSDPDKFDRAMRPFRTDRRPKSAFYPSLLRRLLLEMPSTSPLFGPMADDMLLESVRQQPVIGFDNARVFLTTLHRVRNYPQNVLVEFLDETALQLAAQRLTNRGEYDRADFYLKCTQNFKPAKLKDYETALEKVGSDLDNYDAPIRVAAPRPVETSFASGGLFAKAYEILVP